MSSISAGLEVGKALAIALSDDNLDIPVKLTDMAIKIAPFLIVLGPLVSFVEDFIPTGPSAELLAIQQLHKDMDNRFDQIDGKFRDVTNLIQWNTSGKYIDRYSTDHSDTNMNNHDWANNMYNTLATKYYWRDWMVIAYDDVTGADKHYQRECGGFLKYRSNGRNIVVASLYKK
ncbi:unnamed protein product [Mytilus coruscus]|uniref:Uncharacterized protein n=1 Tax=Mytilus coruscus TaxID=42192 RepID=A0A6J8E6B4_MYTCO|nr:unnamed protein product [Mytilus coruscus]